jgi:hypothetical protein
MENINIGIEFEFFLKEKATFLEKIEEIFKRQLRKITKESIKIINCLNNSKLPDEEKKEKEIFYIEKEPSLNKNGIEFITKVIKFKDLEKYLQKIFEIINEYGYTTEETGLHFHISNENKKELNKEKFILNLKKEKVTKYEEERNELESIFNLVKKDKLIEVNEKYMKNYNINFINDEQYKNHIELRVFGGTKYETKIKEIISDIEKTIMIYKKEEMYLEENKK